MKGYPRRFGALLIGVVALTWITGLLLAPTTLALHASIELPWRLPGAARVGVVAAHLGAALVFVFLGGALWSLHMRQGWRHGRQRRSGLAMASLLIVATGSAVAVLYAGSEWLADGAALLHLGSGLAFVLPLAPHWWRAQKPKHRGRRRSSRWPALRPGGPP